MSQSSYDKLPFVAVSDSEENCWSGWEAVADALNAVIAHTRSGRPRLIVTFECYSGLHDDEVEGALRRGLHFDHFLNTAQAFKSPEEIEALAAPYLGGDDPVFGFLAPLEMDAFLDPGKRNALREQALAVDGVIVLYGPGAAQCAAPDLLVYADMPRWEGQLRQRRGEVSNLGTMNRGLKASLQYKRAYFLDWRVCDRVKKETLSRWDFLLDTTLPGEPKLVTGAALRAGLELTARRPFRVVPFFDPAPWGGQWMREICGLGGGAPNYGWCFDGVPEENSLLLGFGETRLEVPAMDLIFHQPRQVLGDTVFGLFGHEFPIRFDLLDTVGGGSLSLQVHPLVEYVRDKFGMFYTQDESYYLLDADPGASVYLGMKSGADAGQMFQALDDAQRGDTPFEADRFVNRWPATRHDHFLIPSGTIHCSGAGAMVLEISATPYIFTFKLWDWGRLGLDGLPRPINLAHGLRNLQADRNTEWTQANLINRTEWLASGVGWREERTGLHGLEFIETRRHWFTDTVPHDTRGTVNVLNLVQGAEAIVESPSGAFDPFVVHYAETFIVPASVGPYTVRPFGAGISQQCATMKAFIRSFA